MLQSLRLRLLVGGAVWIVLALAIAGYFIVQSFSASIEVERRDNLEASLERLIAAIDPEAPTLVVPDPLSDPRYDTPLSGRYWQIIDTDSGAMVRSRSLWDLELPRASTLAEDARGQVGQIKGPDGRPLIVLSRAIRAEAAAGVRHFSVAVAEARSQDDDPIGRFGENLVLALLMLGLTWFLATLLQVYFGLRPLALLRDQIDAIRRGETERLPASRSVELRPVSNQINELLDAQDATIAFARERAADLAHGLKTPLAVLSATSERLRETGDAPNADLLAMLSEQMNARIEYQLRIARLRYRTRAQGASSSVNEVILRSVAVLRKSREGEHLNWLVNLDEAVRVDMDPHDLLELAGIILENATHWAASQIQIGCSVRDGRAELVVEDDGVGVSDEKIARLGERGIRLDEKASGEGLGLSIAFEILALNRGKMVVDRGRLGGLRASVSLPLADT